MCIFSVEDSVCKRDNKEQSVYCNEGNSESTMYESQQTNKTLREKQTARQPSQCVCCVQRQCAHVCVCVSDFFQSGSSAMRWIKANVSGPTLWLTTNSIQTLLKHSPWTKSQTLCDRESLHSAKWFIIVPIHSPLIWTRTTSCIEQQLRFPQNVIAKRFFLGSIKLYRTIIIFNIF